ncbi:DUF3105 domain-containing protein [Actinosynnema sp. CA-299493]
MSTRRTAAVLGKLLARFVTWSGAPRAAGVLLAVAGLVTAAVLPFVATPSPAQADRDALGSCTTGPNEESYRLGDGGHPSKDFYEPTETYPEPDFAHVLGDGYLLVHYPATLPADQVDALRAHVTGPDGNRVVAGASPGQAQRIKAVHAYQTLKCDQFDLDALKAFATAWFDDPRSEPVG